MKRSYSYHSEQDSLRQYRWIHFSVFLVALLLVLAAVQQLYLYFTAWTTAEESNNWQHLLFGLLYLIAAALLAWLGWRLKNNIGREVDRYLSISDDQLTWNLTQREEEQSVLLADIIKVDRPNIRDLVLTLASGTSITIPIFLISEAEQQEELIDVLASLTDTE